MNTMTPEKFSESMSHLLSKHSGDPEAFHSCADDLICELLNSLGYGEGVNIFLDAEKYYS